MTEHVSKNEWRIPDTLGRGKTYRWTLTPLGDRNAPARPSQPAYFTVADSADARLLAGSTLEYARRMIALHRNDVAEPLLAEIVEGASDLPQAGEAGAGSRVSVTLNLSSHATIAGVACRY